MSVLEDRYRSWLRLLPASYRSVWEEEMVATFLDSVHTDDPEEAEHLAYCGRPSRSELASLVALALRLRLGGVEAPPRSFAWGQAVRLVALVGLLANAWWAAAGVGQELWLAGLIPWPPLPDRVVELMTSGAAAPSGRGVIVGQAFALAWVAAYLALVCNRRRLAQLLAGCALLPGVLAAGAEGAGVVLGGGGALLTTWTLLLVNVLLVAALAAFHRDAPPVRTRAWLGAFGLGLALGPLPVAAFVLQAPEAMVLDWPGLWCVVLVGAAVARLAGARDGPADATRSWTLALALLAAGVLAVRVASLLDYVVHGGARVPPLALLFGGVQAAAVLAVGVLLAVRAARSLRDLPAAPADPKASSAPAP